MYSLRFAVMDEELCVLVEEHPPLYDLSNKDYTNTLLRDKIWKEIGAIINKTPEDCKKQWNLLRSYFVRARSRRKTPTGRLARKLQKWRLEDKMQFLIPFLQEKESVDGTEMEETEEEEEDTKEKSLIPSLSPSISTADSSRASCSNISNRKTARERKKNTFDTNSESTPGRFIASQNQSNFSHSNTPHIPEQKKKLLVFFEDIAESMMNFPVVDRVEIKSEIFNLVSQREIEILKRSGAENCAHTGRNN